MLPPHTAAVLRGMDAGVIAATKTWFRREQGLRAVDMAEDIVSTANGEGEFCKVDNLQRCGGV